MGARVGADPPSIIHLKQTRPAFQGLHTRGEEVINNCLVMDSRILPRLHFNNFHHVIKISSADHGPNSST